MPDCFYDFPKISGTVRGWNQLWCKSCLWRGWKCNFFCLWCKMEVFKDGYGVQTSLTRYLSEQAFGSSKLQILIYVLVAETSWFRHSLLNGSNNVCKNCGYMGWWWSRPRNFFLHFWRLCRQFGIYCTRTRSCLSLGKKMAQAGLKEEDVKKEKDNHQCWSSIYTRPRA